MISVQWYPASAYTFLPLGRPSLLTPAEVFTIRQIRRAQNIQTPDIFLIFLVFSEAEMHLGSPKKRPHNLVPGIRDRQDVSKAGSCGGNRRELWLLTHPGKFLKTLVSYVQNTLSHTQKKKKTNSAGASFGGRRIVHRHMSCWPLSCSSALQCPGSLPHHEWEAVLLLHVVCQWMVLHLLRIMGLC